MLRHLKLKRQQDDVANQQIASAKYHQQESQQQQQDNEQPVRRIRGRRSSKPMMEKRRRARINQCLDTLKSYVLTDPSSLNKLGIDTSASENQDEETIARTILKSSGLINRHRGRKNPNKLEKADILELTVDYVRQLHEQRDHWISVASQLKNQSFQQASIATPLSLNLPVRTALQSTPPSPPPSSASSSPQPLLPISSNIQLCPDVLDLSGKRVATSNSLQVLQPIYRDSLICLDKQPESYWPSSCPDAAVGS